MSRTVLRFITATVLALSALSSLSTATLAQVPPGGLEASVVKADVKTHKATYSAIDYGRTNAASDDRYARTTWRVVEGTGNCCESYVTINSAGRLFDFGGTYIYFSDDRGKSWKRVEPLTPLVNGEGAIVAGPNGDILGIGWDPYSGDHLQAYKYDAAGRKWLWSEMPVHQPFFDREWISVIPGPITVDGTTYPYISLLKGATPYKEIWYSSTNGIDYTEISSKTAEQIASGATAQGRLSTRARGLNDWVQANTNGGMTQLGAGNLLADGDLTSDWYLFNGKTDTWATYQYNAAGDQPDGRFQVDSAGRIHNVIPANDGNSFLYRISADGGQTWRSTTVKLPKYVTIEEWDFRANLSAGVAAVGIHGQNHLKGTDQDLAYKLNIGGNAARLVRQYDLGLGDINSTAGVENDIRLDFGSIAIFPDGRIALPFLDSTTDDQPALAVEQTTTLGGRIKPASTVTPKLGTPYASYTFEQGDEGWTSDGTGTWLRDHPGAKSDGTDDANGFAESVWGPLYADSVDTTLTSPAIATQNGAAVVQFSLKIDTEPGFDYLHIEWSADGDNWLPISDFTARNTGYPNWQKVTLGFNSPGGDVYVRFHFQSDQLCSGLEPVYSCSTYNGARVDNVIVGKQAL